MKKLGIFLLSLSVFALIVWLGGYNFDSRNLVVAYFTSVAIIFSTIITLLTPLENKGIIK